MASANPEVELENFQVLQEPKRARDHIFKTIKAAKKVRGIIIIMQAANKTHLSYCFAHCLSSSIILQKSSRTLKNEHNLSIIWIQTSSATSIISQFYKHNLLEPDSSLQGRTSLVTKPFLPRLHGVVNMAAEFTNLRAVLYHCVAYYERYRS